MPVKLTDETTVMDIPWGDLRPIAMKADFTDSKMFVSTNNVVIKQLFSSVILFTRRLELSSSAYFRTEGAGRHECLTKRTR